MKLRIKIDKSVWMNFLHSFFGGIFGGMVIAFSFGQMPVKGTIGFYVVFGLFFILVAIIGLLIMGRFNYEWEESKSRIPKNTRH